MKEKMTYHIIYSITDTTKKKIVLKHNIWPLWTSKIYIDSEEVVQGTIKEREKIIRE